MLSLASLSVLLNVVHGRRGDDGRNNCFSDFLVCTVSHEQFTLPAFGIEAMQIIRGMA